ncbi:MAG TPA: hypothetical protein VJA40_04785 [archaeon]|nr:hypothetical protein [archaeon]
MKVLVLFQVLVDENVVGGVSTAVESLVGNNFALIGGVLLVLATVFVWFFLKKILENTVLGVAVLALLYFFSPELFAKLWQHLVPTIVATVVFGPGGIGVMLLLAWLGVV